MHEFPENKLFKRCLHGELGEDRSKPWLKPGSLSMKKLNEAIRGKKDCRLKDLEMMTEFQHTSVNENINARHGFKKPVSSRSTCGNKRIFNTQQKSKCLLSGNIEADFGFYFDILLDFGLAPPTADSFRTWKPTSFLGGREAGVTNG